jgi:hypothetical protein
LKCNPAVFRENLIRPGLCPECRMRQFLNVSEWKDHVMKCVNIPHDGAIECRHPRCSEIPRIDNASAFLEHRADIHQIPSSRSGDLGGFGDSGQPSFTLSRWRKRSRNCQRVKRRTVLRRQKDIFVAYTPPVKKQSTLQNRDDRDSRPAGQDPNEEFDSPITTDCGQGSGGEPASDGCNEYCGSARLFPAPQTTTITVEIPPLPADWWTYDEELSDSPWIDDGPNKLQGVGNPKRRRGRPIGSRNKKLKGPDKVAEGRIQKRPRGRPLGSRNRTI